MFSNDLTVPNNFIGLENYKTKTNPQTTTFCDKLYIDDPLALVLGQWTRSSLSHNEEGADSTFTSFINSTIGSINEDELIGSCKKLEKLPISQLILPEPKNYITSTSTNECTSGISNTSIDKLENEESNKSHGKYYLFNKIQIINN